ncbi:DNA adenine methylase Dam [Synechococcus phage ACG-2014b]|uniref:site-specific DNA-methyltransferase (adenine-specific) n=2 Tax=Synechococcus phage ACG-2014b TaxID=1493508 RepID=A0A0E3EVB4_9CAUD|nr:DNA methyltransferase [Synechococcus phage ACG-2014b]YP_009779765.1 DNA methyltransferase [Synechococcus phage ACG-2014b]YP_009779982.1 DNA methyltransferase [Synechococcus phage ACG-2014b]AIX17359.1 DNA adenine methylase Dam [Synechococcus phage ACG-2014b]AIX17574.1 DNA adenine methylase Dam [Synechococcus phage ACG-2014b]AIX17790.1 DNA adenine methylase Dam [Synechococcus phage ACG-2014b]AIX18007.1 DNA adenine methylase Dam [Synechococcus phage ACG-2014b]AIX18222.1 DNA adenine methylase
MTSLKTPLRYPGGKSRATKKMAEFFPLFKDYTEFREPFVGGGSVALYITQMYPHLDIWVNDLYEPLYNFWKELQYDGRKLRDELVQLKNRHPEPVSAKLLFLDAKEKINDDSISNLSRAVSFYIVNKCSFSGLTESSSFSKQASESNFSMRGIDKLPYYGELIQDWRITNLSYEELLTDKKESFVYLDPPYEIKSNLYGRKGGMHKGFDHDEFFFACDRHVCDQMVSYNSSNLIKSRFIDWKPYEYDHTYTMRSVGEYMKDQQQRKELLLLNYVV